MLLLYLITTHLLLSLDPIVNFKASGCEHERLLFECGDMAPNMCLTCGYMSPCIRDRRKYDILAQAVLLLCGVVMLESRML